MSTQSLLFLPSVISDYHLKSIQKWRFSVITWLLLLILSSFQRTKRYVNNWLRISSSAALTPILTYWHTLRWSLICFLDLLVTYSPILFSFTAWMFTNFCFMQLYDDSSYRYCHKSNGLYVNNWLRISSSAALTPILTYWHTLRWSLICFLDLLVTYSPILFSFTAWMFTNFCFMQLYDDSSYRYCHKSNGLGLYVNN